MVFRESRIPISILTVAAGLGGCGESDERHAFDGGAYFHVSSDNDGEADSQGDGSSAMDTEGDTGTAGLDDSYNGQCRLALDGATGDEQDGLIPVCCVPTAEEKALIQEVFELLNAHRASNGVSPLVYDDLLEAAIQGHCRHMASHSFFDHTAPEAEVSSPWDRAELCGTGASGENIANGYRTPDDVMAGWISSSGHNQNMLNSRFARVGIGYVSLGQWDSYWGQIFGE